MKLLVVCSLLLVAACVSVQGEILQSCMTNVDTMPTGQCTGVRVVPDLPNLNHGIAGTFYIENTTTYCIENFFYDGAGPGKLEKVLISLCNFCV